MKTTLSISNYLLQRLKELNIKQVFGVPGDYNLAFLDSIIEDTELQWVGTCNELNGAYASDGYARVNGMGALVTTFGVGELSAINGTAGSYAEYVPVVHIVGFPARSAQQNKALVHHSLGDGQFDVFMKMFAKVTVAQTLLTEENAAAEIDRVLEECWQKKRPVYIGLPADIVNLRVAAPIQPLNLTYPTSDQGKVAECAGRIARYIREAKSPVALLDLCAERHDMKALIENFLAATKIGFAAMNMGKGLIDESHPQFIGHYCGEFSGEGVRERVEQSDCILTFGTLLSDLNTGGFSVQLNPETRIAVHTFYTEVKHSHYSQVLFKDLISALLAELAGYQSPVRNTGRDATPATAVAIQQDQPLSQAYFWQEIGKCLQKDSVVLAEAGTSLFGALEMPLPDGVKFISQVLWGSIGYTLGALLGAKLAAPTRQTVLFIGDGSFQLTAQEISTLLRHNLNPIIFLINNDGYTVERLIHGPEMPYNDIAEWNYQEFPKIFKGNVITQKVATPRELAAVIGQINTGELNKNRLALIEVILPKMDAPEMLVKIGAALDKRNAGN